MFSTSTIVHRDLNIRPQLLTIACLVIGFTEHHRLCYSLHVSPHPLPVSLPLRATHNGKAKFPVLVSTPSYFAAGQPLQPYNRSDGLTSQSLYSKPYSPIDSAAMVRKHFHNCLIHPGTPALEHPREGRFDCSSAWW